MKYFLIILLFSFLGFSQTNEQKKLEQQKQKILQEIEQSRKKLNEVKLKEKSILSVIYENNQKIKLRESLINTTQRQSQVLASEINRNNQEIEALNQEIDQLKKDYAKMIRLSYINQIEQNKLMYLLSSKNFLQAYKRSQYIKQYNKFRAKQANDIFSKKEELELKIDKLQEKKQKQEALLKEQEQEKITLLEEKKEQEKIASTVKKEERELVNNISKRQQEARKIDNQINDLIKKAIAEANRKAAEAKRKEDEKNAIAAGKTTTPAKATPAKTATNKIELTPEGQIVSNNFKANKGKLPWPTQKGYVSMKFGSNPHPLEPSITVNSNGIEITSDDGSSAIAIFDGEVSEVKELSPINMMVIVRHGEFFSTYSNLKSVFVKKGQKIKAKDLIGGLRYSESTKKTSLKFYLSQNDTFINPAQWLAPR